MQEVEVVLTVRRDVGPRLVPELRVLEQEGDRVHPDAGHEVSKNVLGKCESAIAGNFIDTSVGSHFKVSGAAEASPEPVHPLVYPELEDGHHLLLHRGVPVVQVRLLLATSRLIIIIEFQYSHMYHNYC